MKHRTTPPKVRKPKPWHFPTAETFTLPNGLVALLYHRPGQHVVSADLVIDLPLTAEPSEKQGVASLVAATLEDGTHGHPGTNFTDAVEDCGASLDATTTYSATQLTLDVPASRLATGLSLLSEAVSEPFLDDDDIARNRTLRLTEIQHQLASPAHLANIALRRALVQPRYRSSRPAGGTLGTVADVTGEDARLFHARNYDPASGGLVVAGDLPDNIEDQLIDAFGTWPTADQGLLDHEIPEPLAPTASLVHRVGAVQADLRLARFTIDRTDPRWADLQVATRIIGGAFGSRLNRVLREEKGYTYGVGMGNSPMRHGGFSVVQTSVRTEALADTLALLPGLMDANSTPFTAHEVEQARDYLIEAAPMHYATAAGVGRAASNLLTVGLTSDFINATHDAIRRVTPESATEVATELLSADKATLVVVGDAESCEPAIRAAGWDVTTTTAEAVSVP